MHSEHPGGANVLMGDHSVQFIIDDTSFTVCRDLCSRQGGGNNRVLNMSDKGHLVRWFARALVFAILVQCASGCGKPTEETRQNRRLVDSLLTAVITGNQEQLEKCKGMLDQRRSEGLLSDDSHKRLNEIFDQARSGQGGPETALYEFRKSEPFPK
jgi:prepilin-type processing-associated H-X9-DG protein